jgi:hypothetical protein
MSLGIVLCLCESGGRLTFAFFLRNSPQKAPTLCGALNTFDSAENYIKRLRIKLRSLNFYPLPNSFNPSAESLRGAIFLYSD